MSVGGGVLYQMLIVHIYLCPTAGKVFEDFFEIPIRPILAAGVKFLGQVC